MWTIDQANDQGRMAYLNLDLLSDNPYDVEQDSLREAWENGWNIAMEYDKELHANGGCDGCNSQFCIDNCQECDYPWSGSVTADGFLECANCGHFNDCEPNETNM